VGTPLPVASPKSLLEMAAGDRTCVALEDLAKPYALNLATVLVGTISCGALPQALPQCRWHRTESTFFFAVDQNISWIHSKFIADSSLLVILGKG
jgi:hypothetical protein